MARLLSVNVGAPPVVQLPRRTRPGSPGKVGVPVGYSNPTVPMVKPTDWQGEHTSRFSENGRDV
jgi:hypothetical protein